MYSINFYRDKDGNEPIIEYLKKLRKRNDKNSRINLNKINDYIEALSKYGTYLGEPYLSLIHI